YSAESSRLALFRCRSAFGNPAAVGPREHEHAVVGDRDGEPALVHERVVEAAERDEVVELRFSAVGPVLHVVAVAEARAVAAREAAAAVARFQRAPDRGRDATSLAADVQRLAIAAFEHAEDGAVAAESPDRRKRQRRATVELRAM